MSFTGIFGLVILLIAAIALLGPSKLPAGIEQLWLSITNFRRQQAELPTLTLEQARRAWEASENPLYDLIQILYGAVEHLVELRHRIFIVLGWLLGSAIVAFIFSNQLLEIIARPKGDIQLIVLAPIDMLWATFEVIFGTAAVLTLPVMLYQILRFIEPALETPAEKAAYRLIALIGIPLVLLFFILGALFAYFIMLPFALKYLASFGTDIARASWNVRAYFSFTLGVMLWMGAAFETPLIMAILARLGIVSPTAMARQWRYAFVLIAIIAAVITPTVDPLNMMLVMGPLLALYFLGVLFARITYRPRGARPVTAGSQTST
ncbi:MAG: twin-arginine translocase subunit TatC [Anaerolineae bacterium]